jgi:hypothetical protein
LEEDGLNQRAKVNRKDIEDAKVLTKSAEIDITEAEKTGADLTEAKQFLEEAKQHLESLNITQVRISVKKAKTAAADAKRYHRSDLLIQHALPVVDDARRAGADYQKAQRHINSAKEALRDKRYGDLSEYVRQAKREAKEAKRYHRAYLMIENCRTEIINAKQAGADVVEAEAYYEQAQMALENKDYGVVSQSVREAKKAAVRFQKHKKVENLIDEVKPEIDDIKRIGLRTEEIEEAVQQAEEALARRNYAEVRSLVRKIKRRVKKAMERKGATVLIATIEHVIHKAQAKGMDAKEAENLLERARNALETMNYTEIERIIAETNSVAKRLDVMVGGLAENLFSKAKLVDLDKIDMVFSEAERKISAEMAKARMTALKDLMALTRELGLQDDEFKSLFQKAEDAFEARQFDVIEEYKEEFEEKLEEAKMKHKTEFVEVRIKKALELIDKFKEMNIDMDQAVELLNKAQSEVSQKNFEAAQSHVDQVEKLANEMHKRHQATFDLKSAKDVLLDAKNIGMDGTEATDLLTQAESALNQNNFQDASELVEKARSLTTNNVQQFIAGKYPKFTLKLPEGGMEADVWNKCVIEIANEGDLVAKNVNINIKGDLDIKGLEKIESLDVGEKKKLEIGVKPRESGELSLDVLLAYQRAFDSTLYQLNLAKRLVADTQGTYQLQELLLIHNSGVLISQITRKMDIDVDRDIFSGMFTAVQEFIKDSFGRTSDAGLKRMDFGEQKILIEHGSTFFLSSILEGGEPRYLPLYMIEVIKEVQEKYGEVLDGWQGNYSQLEGIDDVVRKLMNVTDAKGADVEGFESGVVANTIKLVEEAKEEGLVAGENEVFVGEFLSAMENEGFERAWGYLVEKGKQVKLEMQSTTARQKLEAMRDLMNSAKELGVDEAEFLTLVDMAETAFNNHEFDSIENYKMAMEEGLEKAKSQHQFNIFEMRIRNVKSVVAKLKEMDLNVESAEELLVKVDEEYNARNLEAAVNYLDSVEEITKDLHQKNDLQSEISKIKNLQKEAEDLGVDIADGKRLLDDAENQLNINNFEKASELIGNSRVATTDIIKQFIEGKFPKFSLTIPKRGMEADVWNKCILDITNSGDLQAKNIGVKFRGALEVMGLDKINVLNVGEKLRLEVGVKPKEAGEISLDIQLAYHRAFDDTLYQLHIPKTVFIESKGTYQLDDVLLIHQSGVLVSHVSRKMGMEMDDDLFSGMFTAVQEFVKDSLGREKNIGLNRMDYGERKILTEQGHLVFLTAIITGGEPMYLPLYMMEILREVHEKYGEILDGWQGDYTKLQGIDEVLRKILQVTNEKGSDVEGFESSMVTSTIKQVEKADFEGGMAGAREALVADFIKTWEVDGYENAWNYLETKGKEVDKEVISKASLKKIEAMKELMTVAKELNTDETEFKTFLDMAQQALESGDFESIDNYKSAFEKSIDEAKSKHKKEIISRRIKNSRIIINQFKELGMDVERAEHLLSEAEEHFSSEDLEGAEMHVDQVERIADELHQENDVRIMLDSVNEIYSEAKEMDMEIAEIDELIGEANSELLTKNYQKALGPLQKAKKIIQDKVSEFVSGKAPKISVALPQRGLEVGTWNKCACEITNDGELLAKNIDITFKGDVDLKAFSSIKKLDVGDTIRTEIGVKPTKAGEVPFEVILTYQKAFDDSYYQLDIPKKVVVDVGGTYQIEQIFLIMNSGVLVSQVARRMEEDIDKEIFSGMLIAVQDFIGDSFRKKGDIGLKRMDFGENKILIEEGKFTFLVAILVGDEPRFLPLFMLEVLNEVEEKYGSVLDGWDGTYTNLTGIEDVIGKLMRVIDERGVDIDGFTSGKVSSTIKLIETAQEDGVRIGGPETFAREILEIIEKKGAEEAWRILENMGKDVEKESQELKEKREGMAELKHAFLRDMDEHYINEMEDNLDMYLRIADKITKVISETRSESDIKPTFPLQVVAIKSKDHVVRDAVKRLKEPLVSKINSKKIEILDPEKDWKGLNLELIPNKEIIHTAYKAQASKVISLLKHQSPWKIKDSLEKRGEYTLGVEGYPVKITAKMMDFKLSTPENVIVKEFEETVIYIDKTVTQEIKAEGIAEELIALINNMRSELNVRDEEYIETQVFVADKTAELLEGMKERIESKTRSYAVEFPFENIFEEGVTGYYTTETDIGGEKATIGIVVVEWEEE